MIIKKQNGFTLIELMVSITIIAIITVIAVVNFGGTQKKARDGRRMSDLEKVRVALELNRQEKGSYPTGNFAAVSAILVGNSYLQAPLVDPKTGFTYYMVGSSYTYTLDAQMESAGSTNGAYTNNCGGPQNCNYRVVSP